jgi:hypothetical protein
VSSVIVPAALPPLVTFHFDSVGEENSAGVAA